MKLKKWKYLNESPNLQLVWLMHSDAMVASGQSRWPQLAVAANNRVFLLAKTDFLGQWKNMWCISVWKKKHLHRLHNNTSLNISFGQQWSSTGLFKEVLKEGKFIPSHVTTIISGADMNTEQKISDTCSINYLNITFQTRCKNNMKSTNIHAGCR